MLVNDDDGRELFITVKCIVRLTDRECHGAAPQGVDSCQISLPPGRESTPLPQYGLIRIDIKEQCTVSEIALLKKISDSLSLSYWLSVYQMHRVMGSQIKGKWIGWLRPL